MTNLELKNSGLVYDPMDAQILEMQFPQMFWL